MFCENCGAEVADDAEFCSGCGRKIHKKAKNIYIALILTFILTGLGSIYAGNAKKGIILLAARLIAAALSIVTVIFAAVSLIIWAYGFYEAYRDTQIANGHENPKLLEDLRRWERSKKTAAVLIICIVITLTALGCVAIVMSDGHNTLDSSSHHTIHSTPGGSSHYGGVDTSPNTIAKKDPDWYYDHYEYGDNPDVDDYLESQGYD